MNISDVDLSYYQLQLTGYSLDFDTITQIQIAELKLQSFTPNANVDKLLQDMRLINNARNSASPAVQDALEQLITLMALAH